MSTYNTLMLLRAIANEAALRRELVSCNSFDELSEFLFNRGFHLSRADFDLTISQLLDEPTDENKSLLNVVGWFQHIMLTAG